MSYLAFPPDLFDIVPSPKTPSTLDQEICSNFACCGLRLPDMHALLDHFEDKHVVVFDAAGRPVHPAHAPAAHPRSRSPSPAPAAYASLVLNYPQPDPPAEPDLFDAYLTSAADNTYHRSAALPALDTDALPELDPDASSSTASSPAMSEQQLCVPPAVLSVYPGAYVESGRAAGPPPEDELPRTITPLALHPARVKAKLFNAAARKPRRPDRPSPTRRRDREKAFKCPHSGCMKSYLNPNGLKYHLEKGTCVIDPGPRGDAPSPAPADVDAPPVYAPSVYAPTGSLSTPQPV